MPKLDAAWIKEQLEFCEKAMQAPWRDGFDDESGHIGDYRGAWIVQEGTDEIVIWGGNHDGIPVGILKQENVDFITAAREGYPLVLKELQDFRTSFALYSQACRVGRELFLEAHPEFGELTDPDTGEMVTWLVEQVRRRPWTECPRCGEMCLEQDMVGGLCARCAEEES